jgi:hypothetical protein
VQTPEAAITLLTTIVMSLGEVKVKCAICGLRILMLCTQNPNRPLAFMSEVPIELFHLFWFNVSKIIGNHLPSVFFFVNLQGERADSLENLWKNDSQYVQLHKKEVDNGT